LPLLRPDTLRELQLTLIPKDILGIDFAPTFPYVHKLTVTLDLSAQTPNLKRILPKFPALQVLSMHDCGMDNIHGNPADLRVPLPGFSAPLKEYTGPYESLNMFLHMPTLTHLTINYCREPHVLINELKGVERQNSVASLSIRLGSFNYALFDALCGFFPVLTRLRIDVLAPEDNVDDVELWDWKVSSQHAFCSMR
jgi:hypothetical protein